MTYSTWLAHLWKAHHSILCGIYRWPCASSVCCWSQSYTCQNCKSPHAIQQWSSPQCLKEDRCFVYLYFLGFMDSYMSLYLWPSCIIFVGRITCIYVFMCNVIVFLYNQLWPLKTPLECWIYLTSKVKCWLFKCCWYWSQVLRSSALSHSVTRTWQALSATLVNGVYYNSFLSLEMNRVLGVNHFI